MTTDELFAPLRDVHESTGWREPARLRAVATRRRRVRRGLAGAAAVIAAVGVVTAVDHSTGRSSDGGSRPVVGAHLLMAKVAPLAGHDDPASIAVARAERQFAVELLKQTPSDGSNTALSPMSLAIALAMLQTGARGTTASEIATVLHTSGLSSTTQDAGWAALATDLASAKGVTVQSANSLWVQRDFPVKAGYLDALARYFRSGVWTVDFANDPAAALRAIDAWTNQRTHGRITKLFDGLDPSTVAVLANALYFQARWQTAFDPKKTLPFPFYRAGGGTVSVPFMTTDAKVSDRLGAGWQSAQVPFAGGRYAALFVMPTKGTLRELIAGLDTRQLDEFAATTPDPEGRLVVPRFELSTFTHLEDTLRRLGMRAAFGGGDFSGLSPVAVQVDQVVQRDYLKIDEHGATAAAATGISVIPLSGRWPGLGAFDHPFLFLIRDTKTGAILFTAQINNPAAR